MLGLVDRIVVPVNLNLGQLHLNSKAAYMDEKVHSWVSVIFLQTLLQQRFGFKMAAIGLFLLLRWAFLVA